MSMKLLVPEGNYTSVEFHMTFHPQLYERAPIKLHKSHLIK